MASKKSQATELYGDLQKLKSLFMQKGLAHDLGSSKTEQQLDAKIKIVCGKISKNKRAKKLLRQLDGDVQSAIAERDELMRNGELSEAERQTPEGQAIIDKLAELDSTINNRVDATHSQDIYKKLYHDGQQIDPTMFEQLSDKLLDIGIDEKALSKRHFMSQDKGFAKSKQAMIDLITDTKSKLNAGGDLKAKEAARNQSQKVKHKARDAYKDLRFGGLRRLFGSDKAKQAYEKYDGARTDDRAKEKDRKAAKRSYKDAFAGQEKSEKRAHKRLKSSMPDYARYMMEEFLEKQDKLLDKGKSTLEATNAALDKMQADVNKTFDALLNISSDVKASIAQVDDQENAADAAPAVPPLPGADAAVAPPEPDEPATEQSEEQVDLVASSAANARPGAEQQAEVIYGTLPIARTNFPERREMLIHDLEHANSLQAFQEHISKYRETLVSERQEHGQGALGAEYDKEINVITEFETSMRQYQDLSICKQFAKPHLRDSYSASEQRQSMPLPQPERAPVTRQRSQSDIGPSAQAQAAQAPTNYQSMARQANNTHMHGARDARGNRVQGEVGAYGSPNVMMNAEVGQPYAERPQAAQQGDQAARQPNHAQDQQPTAAAPQPTADSQYAAIPTRANWDSEGGSKLPESGQGDPPPPRSAQAQQAAATGEHGAAGPGATNERRGDEPAAGNDDNDADPENTDAPKYW